MKAAVFGPGRRTEPAHGAPGRVAAHGAGDGVLSDLALRIRYGEIEIRHGAAVEGLGKACRGLNKSLAAWDGRRAREGNAAVAMDPGFRADLRAAGAVLRAARPYMKDDPLHRRLLAERGGIAADDLEELASRRKRGRSIRDMSIEERRGADPGFVPAPPARRPEEARIEAIGRALDALKPVASRDIPVEAVEPSIGTAAAPAKRKPKLRQEPSPADTRPAAVSAAEAVTLHRRFLANAIVNRRAARSRGLHPYETEEAPGLIEQARALLRLEALPADRARSLRDDVARYDEWFRSGRRAPKPAPGAEQPRQRPRKSREQAEFDALYDRLLADARANRAAARRQGIHPYGTEEAPGLVERGRALLRLEALPAASTRVLRNTVAAYDEWLTSRRAPGPAPGAEQTPRPRTAPAASAKARRDAPSARPEPSRQPAPGTTRPILLHRRHAIRRRAGGGEGPGCGERAGREPRAGRGVPPAGARGRAPPHGTLDRRDRTGQRGERGGAAGLARRRPRGPRRGRGAGAGHPEEGDRGASRRVRRVAVRDRLQDARDPDRDRPGREGPRRTRPAGGGGTGGARRRTRPRGETRPRGRGRTIPAPGGRGSGERRASRPRHSAALRPRPARGREARRQARRLPRPARDPAGPGREHPPPLPAGRRSRKAPRRLAAHGQPRDRCRARAPRETRATPPSSTPMAAGTGSRPQPPASKRPPCSTTCRRPSRAPGRRSRTGSARPAATATSWTSTTPPGSRRPCGRGASGATRRGASSRRRPRCASAWTNGRAGSRARRTGCGACAAEREAAADGPPFVERAGYGEWRARAHEAVQDAARILDEREAFAPHFRGAPRAGGGAGGAVLGARPGDGRGARGMGAHRGRARACRGRARAHRTRAAPGREGGKGAAPGPAHKHGSRLLDVTAPAAGVGDNVRHVIERKLDSSPSDLSTLGFGNEGTPISLQNHILWLAFAIAQIIVAAI